MIRQSIERWSADCSNSMPDYKILYAEDGTDALMKMERDRPDIVVTDLNMPQRTA